MMDLLLEPGQTPTPNERDYTPEDHEKVKEYWKDYPVIYDENLPAKWRAPEGTAEVDGVYVKNCPFRKMRGSIKSMQTRDMTGGVGTNGWNTIGLYNYPLAILLRIVAKMAAAADGKDYFVLPFRIKETRAIPSIKSGSGGVKYNHGDYGKLTVRRFLIGLIETDYYLARGTEQAIVNRLDDDVCDWHAAYYNGVIYGFKREDAKDVFNAATQMEAKTAQRRKADPVVSIGSGITTGRRRRIDGW